MFELKKYRRLLNISFFFILFFLFFNFKFENNLSFVTCEILFIIYVLSIIQILKSKIFKYIFEPPVFFLFFAFIYEFLKFPYYFKFSSTASLVKASNLITPKYTIDDYYENSSYMLIYQSICLFVLLFFYINSSKFKSRFNYKNIKIVEIEKILIVLSAFFLLSGFIGLYSITGGNIFLLLTRRAGSSDASDILGSNYLVSFSSIFVLITMPIIIGFRFHMNKIWNKLLIIYIPGIFLSYITTGGRGFLLYSIISLIIIISGKISIKINFSKLFIIGSSAILLFSSLGLIRRSFSDTTNILENLKSRTDTESQWYYELTGYQLQFRDEMVFANANRVGYLHGKTYLNLIFFPIPRSFIGDLKPNFVDSEVANNFWRRDDVGLPLNSMIESYYNFGFFGIIVFVLIGLIMSKITYFILNNKSIILTCFAIVLLLYSQTWSTTYLVYVFQYLFVLYLPLFFSKIKIQ
jgi:oligosaccharide repeat unit polymerase